MVGCVLFRDPAGPRDAFSLVPAYLRDDPDGTDRLNELIPAAVQRRGRAFLTGTRLAGTAALRACILNPATTEADLDVLLDEIRDSAREISA